MTEELVHQIEQMSLERKEMLEEACRLLEKLIPFALNCHADPEKVLPVVNAARHLVERASPKKKQKIPKHPLPRQLRKS